MDNDQNLSADAAAVDIARSAEAVPQLSHDELERENRLLKERLRAALADAPRALKQLRSVCVKTLEENAHLKGRHTFTYTVSRFEDAKRLALKCAIAGQVAIAEGDARTISKGELLLEAAKTIEALVALADGNQTTMQSSVPSRGSAAP